MDTNRGLLVILALIALGLVAYYILGERRSVTRTQSPPVTQPAQPNPSPTPAPSPAPTPTP